MTNCHSTQCIYTREGQKVDRSLVGTRATSSTFSANCPLRHRSISIARRLSTSSQSTWALSLTHVWELLLGRESLKVTKMLREALYYQSPSVEEIPPPNSPLQWPTLRDCASTVLLMLSVTEHFPHGAVAFAFPFPLQRSFDWGKWAMDSQARKNKKIFPSTLHTNLHQFNPDTSHYSFLHLMENTDKHKSCGHGET